MGKSKRNGRGGARENAGRKPKFDGPSSRITVRIPDEMREYLETQDETISDVIVQLIGRSRGYRDYRKATRT